MSAATPHGQTPYYFVPAPSRHPVLAATGLLFVILGAGQWINGHFVALSTLAYPEPLQYLAESLRRMEMLGTAGSSRWATIGAELMAYWAGESSLTRIR